MRSSPERYEYGGGPVGDRSADVAHKMTRGFVTGVFESKNGGMRWDQTRQTDKTT